MIRGNNIDILTLAEEAAFLYWISGEEKYARFAADIFYTWLPGTYYMDPILDPDKSTGGYGGYEPGGICGYYDYEQIHDDLAMHAAIIYDFLHSYLNKHPHPHLQETGKSLTEMAGIVFKRFIDIGFVRGGRTGNWNVNGWNVMLRPILALENNEFYPDGKGRDYYLHYLTSQSTEYHEAIPDMVKTYDPITGLWPESPGYSFSTIQMLLDFSVMLINSGIDIPAENPILQKAAMAVFPWMDEQGNMVVFGDSRGGPANFLTFENLLTYYSKIKDEERASQVAAALNAGIQSGNYSRSNAGWKGLCTFIPSIPHTGNVKNERSSYSSHHRFIAMKNFDGENKLMATLYGGKKGYHLNPNGLAIQLYGFGYALAPDAAAYESYWSSDMAYHQTATGSNTIMPGYTEGEITIHAMEPSVPADEFTDRDELTPFVNFADVSADEKRRTLAIIRTSSQTGYYVDIFRSNLTDNDYIFHNLGTDLSIYDYNNSRLPLAETKSMGQIYSKGYDWFKNPRKIHFNHNFKAEWEMPVISPTITMNMWMVGTQGREIYKVDAPYTTLNGALTPGGICTPPSVTPTLIIRQNGNNAWDNPFMAVFEPVKGEHKSIADVQPYGNGKEVKGIVVTSLNNRRDYILSSTGGETQILDNNTEFCGTFSVITENDGEVEMLYLGKGNFLKRGNYSIETLDEAYVSIYKQEKEWYYSSDKETIINFEGRSVRLKPGYQKKIAE